MAFSTRCVMTGTLVRHSRLRLCWQTLNANGLARNAEIIGIEADLRRGAAAVEILSEKCWQSTSEL